MWVLSVELLLNAFPHWLHLWGFSCTGVREAGQRGLRGEQGRPPATRPPPTYLRVDDFVPAQGAGLAEALPADLADERPGPRVHRHVAGEVVVRVEHLRGKRGEGEVRHGPAAAPGSPRPVPASPLPCRRPRR